MTRDPNMTARTNVDELPAFDAAPYLDSDAAISAWLTDILQATDAGLLSAALGDSARARGMTEIAKAAGITREALCKALRPAARRASIRSAVFIPPPGGRPAGSLWGALHSTEVAGRFPSQRRRRTSAGWSVGGLPSPPITQWLQKDRTVINVN